MNISFIFLVAGCVHWRRECLYRGGSAFKHSTFRPVLFSGFIAPCRLTIINAKLIVCDWLKRSLEVLRLYVSIIGKVKSWGSCRGQKNHG